MHMAARRVDFELVACIHSMAGAVGKDLWYYDLFFLVVTCMHTDEFFVGLSVRAGILEELVTEGVGDNGFR